MSQTNSDIKIRILEIRLKVQTSILNVIYRYKIGLHL